MTQVLSPALAVKDPTSAPTYRPSAFQRWIEGLLYDPRDAVFVRVTLRAFLLMVPMIAMLYWRFSWWMAPVFWAVQIFIEAPVILMLHNTMHRPFFKRRPWLNRAHPYLMSALFGIPTGYMEHHVAMHHVENNLGDDISSTMRYQRDSILGVLLYIGRFLVFSHVRSLEVSPLPGPRSAGQARGLQRHRAHERHRRPVPGELAGDAGRVRGALRSRCGS